MQNADADGQYILYLIYKYDVKLNQMVVENIHPQTLNKALTVQHVNGYYSASEHLCATKSHFEFICLKIQGMFKDFSYFQLDK